MLGSAVVRQIRLSGLEALTASRTQGIIFDALSESCDQLISSSELKPGDVIVNCLGLTKSHIDETNADSVDEAVRINALFPFELCKAAHRVGVRVIQVATDCVFSGQAGGYLENSPHDAHDVYGKTKSLGEAKAENLMILRCSLIGPEQYGRSTLFFEWVRNLPQDSEIEGFRNHRWNGLTSQTFGDMVSGIVINGWFAPGVQHLVPADDVTKYELVKMELNLLGRADVRVRERDASISVDRTLATICPERNRELFLMAGFSTVPTIREMMERLPWAKLRVR